MRTRPEGRDLCKVQVITADAALAGGAGAPLRPHGGHEEKDEEEGERKGAHLSRLGPQMGLFLARPDHVTCHWPVRAEGGERATETIRHAPLRNADMEVVVVRASSLKAYPRIHLEGGKERERSTSIPSSDFSSSKQWQEKDLAPAALRRLSETARSRSRSRSSSSGAHSERVTCSRRQIATTRSEGRGAKAARCCGRR